MKENNLEIKCSSFDEFTMSICWGYFFDTKKKIVWRKNIQKNIQKLILEQNSIIKIVTKFQIVTKLNSNCNKTKKTQMVKKLKEKQKSNTTKNSNCDINYKNKLWQNSNAGIVIKLKFRNFFKQICNKTKKK